jgi:hypothetical protein
MIKFCKIELLGKGKIEWKGQPDDLMDSLNKMIDDKILRIDKKELPGQSHKLISELNIIKPNLRDGYGIKFENSPRSESGLSEITIGLERETFERAVNYSKDNKDNKSSTSNNGTANNNNDKSKNQSTGLSSEKEQDETKEEPLPSNNQNVQETETATEDNNKNNNNDSIKNRFGLGTEAEAWDNESYDDEDADVGD